MRESGETGEGDVMEIDDKFVEWLNVFLVFIENDPLNLYVNYPRFYEYLMSLSATIVPEGKHFPIL